MASGQSYPSPTQAQISSGVGPFYHQHNGDGQTPPPPQNLQNQEVEDDLQLRADLSRSLAGHLQQEQHTPQPQPPHYAQQQDPHAQLAQSVMGFPDHQQSPVDQGPDSAKNKDKRTKVSRACDECRRKKIRCDAPNESGEEACSSCKRTGAVCAFSRQPMKRGPSKGYIKELADRLNSLESQMQPHHMHQHHAEMQFLQQTLAEEGIHRGPDMPRFTSPPSQAGQKRTHDMSEGFFDINGPPSRPPPSFNNTFGEPPRPMQYPPMGPPPPQMPPSQPQTPQPIHSNPAPVPPNPFNAPLQPFFKYGGDTGRRESESTPFDSDANSVATLIDWDEAVIDEYYRIIHQTFPLLPRSKQRLKQRLAECPSSLREAFLTALETTMRTFPSSSLRANHSYGPAIKRAAELLAGYPFENPATHTTGTNLVYLQTLILMALESDNHGPATIRGQAGPSRAEWLGRAAGVAGQLEINLIRPRERFVSEGDPDSEERLARRVWWVLFILDRWHASSTSDLLKLPENSVVLLPEDQSLLGESTYHLARLSFIIGHLAAILTTTKTPETNVMAPTNPASQLLGLTLAGEIDRFRESVESVWGSLNLVHLSYHHCHLLIKRLNPMTEPTELIGHALKVATVLNQRQTPITPLNHHFAALSAMTLCELVDVDKTRADAIKGIEQIAEALGLGRGISGHEESTGWDSAIRDLVVKKQAGLQAQPGAAVGPDGVLAALQGLADAAAKEQPPALDGNVAATANGSERASGQGRFDPTMLTRYGYLTALGQGMFQSR